MKPLLNKKKIPNRATDQFFDQMENLEPFYDRLSAWVFSRATLYNNSALNTRNEMKMKVE